MSEAISKMVNSIVDKDYSTANDTFNQIISQRLDTSLNQAKVKAAASIFNPEVAIEPDFESEVGTVTVDDIADQEVIDQLEAEIDDMDDEEIEAAADEDHESEDVEVFDSEYDEDDEDSEDES